MNDSTNAAEPHDSMIDVINAYKKDVDRTLLRENLKLTVEERVRKAQLFHAYVEELRGAGKKLRRHAGAQS
jgi:hypothetical protein